MVAVALSRSLLFSVASSFKIRRGIVLMRLENEQRRLAFLLAVRKKMHCFCYILLYLGTM